MKRVTHFFQNIRYSLWFVPAILMAVGVLAALLSIEADSRISRGSVQLWPWLFGANADGARSLLQAVAGAMITVAALTFSITVLVLSLGASQYTPRVIRTFMGNRATQFVLGTFAAIFVYCVIVMRSMQAVGESLLPSIAITVAVVLSIVGVGVLIFFIHHIASSIQASTVVSSVSEDTSRAIDEIYPDALGGRRSSDALWRLTRLERFEWHPICSLRAGYVQSFDRDGLSAFAKKYNVIVKMEKMPGDFTSRGLALAYITGAPNTKMVRELNCCYSVGPHRTVEQDVGVGIRQLVDIALKAMSPAINDTTTATMCIDYLSSIMIKLAARRIAPEPEFAAGELLLIPKGPDFGDFLRLSFEQIREHANNNVAIYVRLLEALETLACLTKDTARKKDIAEQVKLVSDYARCNVQFPDQLKKIENHRTQALKHCLLEAAAL